jgi:hypothetical protein
VSLEKKEEEIVKNILSFLLTGVRLQPHHDPIHDQSWYLDKILRARLYAEYGKYLFLVACSFFNKKVLYEFDYLILVKYLIQLITEYYLENFNFLASPDHSHSNRNC